MRMGKLAGAFLPLLLAVACASESDSNSTDAATAGATVSGIITFPAVAANRGYSVRLAATQPGIASPAFEVFGLTDATTSLSYSIPNVTPGTYFMLAFVDVDSSGGDSSTTGDFVGWYGHSGDGNPPPAANVVVPAQGTVKLDFTLVQR